MLVSQFARQIDQLRADSIARLYRLHRPLGLKPVAWVYRLEVAVALLQQRDVPLREARTDGRGEDGRAHSAMEDAVFEPRRTRSLFAHVYRMSAAREAHSQVQVFGAHFAATAEGFACFNQPVPRFR